MKAQSDIYQRVTDRIITALEAGTAPWVKPWTGKGLAGEIIPCNAPTGRSYSGINVLLLWVAAEERGFSRQRWLTLKQVHAAGGRVIEEEIRRSTEICLYRPLIKPELDMDGKEVMDEEGKPKERVVPLFRGFRVFNVQQCEGLPEQLVGSRIEATPQWAAHAAADQVIKVSGVPIEHVLGDDAYYSPVLDKVRLPLQSQFDDAERYYSTALHELTHATGHQSRLARDGIVAFEGFGSESYAHEELVAELGAAFLCAQLGIEGRLQDHNASYIASWLKALQSDKRAIFRATGKARNAAEYLLARVEHYSQQAA
ncbi:ArdC family protein [Billgrantia desiderata]|uniref:ArdC family protein n=1 Tax=Billgrantia desiderata TaxID=52021 RepID=UPI00089E14FB|nr:zincin-like metallopeptidase domain-containing protein [Halomonas desiderata]SEG29748.1 Antirestriction protein ArdC [Halomonas desiderata]